MSNPCCGRGAGTYTFFVHSREELYASHKARFGGKLCAPYTVNNPNGCTGISQLKICNTDGVGRISGSSSVGESRQPQNDRPKSTPSTVECLGSKWRQPTIYTNGDTIALGGSLHQGARKTSTSSRGTAEAIPATDTHESNTPTDESALVFRRVSPQSAALVAQPRRELPARYPATSSADRAGQLPRELPPIFSSFIIQQLQTAKNAKAWRDRTNKAWTL